MDKLSRDLPAGPLGLGAALLAAVALLLGGCAEQVTRTGLPISDDFSGECSWSEDNDEHIALACEDGEYRVLYKRADERIHHVIPKRVEEPVASVAVEADAALAAFPGGSSEELQLHGVGCFASGVGEPSQGYLFLVGPTVGGVAVVRQDETDETLEDSLFLSALVDEESPAVVPAGETTRIRAECEETGDGVELTMYLDGEEVARARDPEGFGPFEAFGFVTFSSRTDTDIRFDNFHAEELGGS